METNTLIHLWKLSRPLAAFWLTWILLIGYGYAHWEWGAELHGAGSFLTVVLSWWFLNAGTLWLNAALDQDAGEVLFQREPVPVPKHTEALGYGALVIALGISTFAGPVAALCSAGCGTLALFYSHKKIRWKGHMLGGPAVNLLGYGLLTPLAGYAQAGFPLTWRSVASVVILSIWILGVYFSAQIFQEQEDRERRYHTYVALRGAAATVRLASNLFMLALLLMLSGVLFGYYPRLCLLALPLLLLLFRYLVRWKRSARAAEPQAFTRRAATAAHLRMMYCGLILFWLAYCDYLADYSRGRPAAGWATERGSPTLWRTPI